MIYPTNQILEDYLFLFIKLDAKNEKHKKAKYYIQNFSRLLICVAATYCAVELEKKLDVFLSILGALLCAPIALTFPTLLHLKQVAVTTKEKVIDIFLIILSIAVLVLSTYQSIQGWNKKS